MAAKIVVLLCALTTVLGAPNAGSRIVGGEDAKLGQFPFQASIRYNREHFCGGSIINKNTILTAAHCVYGFGPGPAGMTVNVGTNSLHESGQYHFVETVKWHHDYLPEHGHNDIAILKLRADITFDENTQPIKMAEAKPEIDSDLVLSGWGMTSYPTGDLADQLQFVNVKSLSFGLCLDMVGEDAQLDEGNICSIAKSGHGACIGDSGSPLVDGNGDQAGIVSMGYPCGLGMPDIYTSTTFYNDWIKENL